MMTVDVTDYDEFTQFLPRTAKELVKLIGFYEVQKLLGKHGGTRRYIPKKSSRKSLAWSIISKKTFCKLCATYGGETIELPKLDSIRRAERDFEIMLLTTKGASRSQLGKRYDLTLRQIGNIRKRYRLTTDNPDFSIIATSTHVGGITTPATQPHCSNNLKIKGWV